MYWSFDLKINLKSNEREPNDGGCTRHNKACFFDAKEEYAAFKRRIGTQALQLKMWEDHYDPLSDKFNDALGKITTPHELDELIYQKFMNDYF